MKIYIVLIVIVFPFLVFSQEQILEDTTQNTSGVLTSGDIIQKNIDMILSQSISPSPNASTFSQVGDLSVNEYTGAFSTNIPLFNLKSHGVDLPISISYQTNGIKINDIPSNVGLGWSLNAGGVINRTVKGVCDEMNYSISIETGYENMVGYQQLDFGGGWAGKGADCLPDEFNINVPGHLSGDFYFKRSRDIMEGTFNGNKINASRYISPGTYYDFISGFDVLDRNGNKFIFQDVEKIKTYSSQELGVNYNGNYNYYTSSFFLTNINNNVDMTAFSFEYIEYSNLTYPDLSLKSYFRDNVLSGGCTICTDHLYPSYLPPTVARVSSSRKVLTGKKLNRILFQDGYLKFNYVDERLDVPEDYALNSIELYNLNDELVKGYEFEYDYFVSEGGSSSEYNYRLKLVRIQEYGDDLSKNPPYQFVYNEIPIAPRNSYKYDAWGYNNGTGSNASMTTMYYYPSLSGLLSPFFLEGYTGGDMTMLSNSYSQIRFSNENANAGVLEIIKYPTGGVHTIDYELNEFVYNNVTYQGGGIRVKHFTTHNDGSLEKTIKYDYTLENSAISSGLINLIPQYGYSCNGHTNDGLVFTSNDNNIPAYIHEPSISYSCVKKEIYNTEGDQFNGTEITLFHSIDDIPNDPVTYSIDEEMFVCTSYNWNLAAISENDYPYFNNFSNEQKRGKISKKKYFDNTGVLVKEDNYTYSYQVFDQINIAQSRYYFYANNEHCNDYYAIIGEYDLNSSRNFVESVTSKGVFGNGFVLSENEMTYDNMANLSTSRFTSGNNDVMLEYKYLYDFDFADHPIGSDPITDGFHILYNRNILSNPIESVKKIKKDTDWSIVGGELNVPVAINTNIAGIDRIKYIEFENPKPESQFSFANIASDASISHDPEYETKIIFDNYDPVTGQIREFHKEHDIHYVILWGYNRLYPVAKIENSTYSEVETAIAQLGISSYDDLQQLSQVQLSNLFDNLRNLNQMKMSLITSYSYRPLYGISSLTDPRGIKTYFEYDSFGRLQVVSDSDNNINQYIEYHHKTQNDCYLDKQTCIQEAYNNYLLRHLLCLELYSDPEAFLECTENNTLLYEQALQDCETQFQECIMSK